MPSTIREAIPLEAAPASPPPSRRPEWLKVRAPQGETYEFVLRLMRSKRLHTVCEEARCPNIGECWGRGTATFMILGDVCTRSCRFCAVKTGRPLPVDWDEPNRVAEAVRAMGLSHVVITSVNRDELPDGGATLFAMTIRRIRERVPGCTVEVLTPDFKGSLEALRIVIEARPDIFNHNVERFYRPEEFEELRQIAYELGFKWVESGPLVRSSYRAEAQARALSRAAPAA